jgi:hypothetical protein
MMFRKNKDGAMEKNNYIEPNKITVVGCMDKAR